MWVAAGQDPSRFWSLTPREIDVILGGVGDRIAREHDARAWSAWHTAYLTAYAPKKPRQFPKLDRLRGRAQTPEQMKAVIRTAAPRA